MITLRTSFLLAVALVPTCVFAADKVNVDDRYFDAVVYEQLAEFGKTDGWRVDRERYGKGEVLTRQQVAAIALDRFLRQAESLGIAEGDITRAMFEGRLNPIIDYPRMTESGLYRESGPGDLTLVYEALGVSHERAKEWNRRFGAIWDLDVVDTVFYEQPVTVSGEDVMFRLYLRMTPVSELQRRYGTAQRHDLRYESFREELQKRRGDLTATVLDTEIAKWVRPELVSAYFYFTRMSVPDPKMDLERDYYTLRRMKYLPSLARTMLKEIER